MKGSNHIIITFLVFLILSFYVNIPFGDLFLIIPITILPDVDLKFETFKHRNILFHSIIIPLFALFGGFGIFEVCIILSFGIHLLCDIKLETTGGTYCLYVWNGRLNYRKSTLWLLSNGLLSIILFWCYV